MILICAPAHRSWRRQVDEISLADDAVLERLNSVLEPNRLLVLAERSGEGVEELTAHENFRFLATMNPGGDFGKKVRVGLFLVCRWWLASDVLLWLTAGCACAGAVAGLAQSLHRDLGARRPRRG